MPTLYIMVGVGFTGKTTLAKKISEHFSISLVSQDAIFFENKKQLNLIKDDDEHWEILLNMCKDKIRKLLKDGKSVVFDNVNLRRKHRDDLRTIAKEFGGKSVVVYLDTPEELLNSRQDKNKLSRDRHDVEQKHLDDAKAQLEIPTADEDVYTFTPETDMADFLAKLPR